jgi:polyisoprenoid-binding protein YceI
MTHKTTWVLDPAHSELLFKVKHLMISNVKGEFRSFQSEITSSENDFTDAKINLTIDANSIYTNNNDRDAHLKSADFFDVAQFNAITFESSSFKHINDDKYLLIGKLTIKGVSNEMSMDVEFGGINKDPWGNEKAGFSLNGTINRKEWGLIWNAPLETGGLLVSDEVKLSAEIQLTKKV